MHERETDFDLKVRFILENAEEEVPSRVWDAIAGRMDRKARRPVILTWAGVAAAAAVVIGVFFANSNTQQILTKHNPISAAGDPDRKRQDSAAAEHEIPAVEAQIAAASGQIALAADRRQGNATASGQAALAEDRQNAAEEERLYAPSELTAPETAAAEAEERAAEAVSPERKETDSGAGKSSGPAAGNHVFDSEVTPKKRSPRIALYAGGNVSTNGNPSTTFSGPRRSQSATRQEGITEVSESSTYGVPISFGAGVTYSFSKRISLGAGLNYSLLTRSFSGIYRDAAGTSVSGDIYNYQHYIGIPVNLYFDLIRASDLRFYTYAGGTVEKGLSNRYRIEAEPGTRYYHERIDGVQVSAGLGLGVEFRIVNHFGLYADPSVRYYFDCGQPKSIRTQKPFMVNFEVGMRWGF